MTRDRIVEAGAALARQRSMWDWDEITVGAVADRANVNRRTVYRHFANERELRDAVMQRLTEEAGVNFESMDFKDVPEMAAKVFRYVIASPLEPWKDRDEAYHAAERRRRDALLAAVRSSSSESNPADPRVVAGLIDLLWGVASLEHLVSTWGIEAPDAINALLWLMGVLQKAIGDGQAIEPT